MREEPFAEKSLMDSYRKRFLSEEQPEEVDNIKEEE